MDQTPDELIPTRATLLQRLKDWQDQASWQDFFDTYWNLIYGVAIKGGLTPAEAQDVVQETMLAVAKHMPQFQYNPNIGSFKGWLLQLTRWRMTDQLRKRGLQPPLAKPSDAAQPEDIAAELDAGQVDPELEKLWDVEWENNLLQAALTKAKRKLDPKHYQIFDFCVNKAWPPEKISTLFGITVGQVYVTKHRVTEAIKEEVERLRKEVI
jgi:RNA polymerase sigma-70 factor (ECF subfamily)